MCQQVRKDNEKKWIAASLEPKKKGEKLPSRLSKKQKVKSEKFNIIKNFHRRRRITVRSFSLEINNKLSEFSVGPFCQ